MGFEKQANGGDEILELQGFKVFVLINHLLLLDFEPVSRHPTLAVVSVKLLKNR